MAWYDNNIFEKVVGKTVGNIEYSGCDEVDFQFTDGYSLRFYHSQDCCETVEVEKIEGAVFSEVKGKVIKSFLEEVDVETIGVHCDSKTKTLYTITFESGEVITILWVGTSNGYYSENVDYILEYTGLPC